MAYPDASSHPVAAALPAGPRWPGLIQAVWWGLDPIGFVKRCLHRHGPTFTVRFPVIGEFVVLADPEAIKAVFTSQRELFLAGEANAAAAPFLRQLGEHSLLLLDGEEHLRQRRLMLPAFHGETVRAYVALVEEIAAAEIDRWPAGKAFPIRPRLQAITLEVILRAVIGIQDQRRLARLRALLPQLLDVGLLGTAAAWISPNLMDTPLGRLHRTMRAGPEVDPLLYEEIAEHRAHPDERHDILATLVQARDEHGEGLGDEALRDQIITLLLAGHETTTTALAWCFERLLRHPDALRRLQDELAAGDGEAYMGAVINETLRVRPVIDGVARKLTAPAEIAGHRLPAGTLVMPSISLAHYSHAYGDPDRFRPERFLQGAPRPYTLIPFGGGPRRCIGASFATMEMKTILRTVLERVELRAPDPRPETIRPRHITLVPARGAQVLITARKQPRPPRTSGSPTATPVPDIASLVHDT